jgi:hypothetical protein
LAGDSANNRDVAPDLRDVLPGAERPRREALGRLAEFAQEGGELVLLAIEARAELFHLVEPDVGEDQLAGPVLAQDTRQTAKVVRIPVCERREPENATLAKAQLDVF